MRKLNFLILVALVGVLIIATVSVSGCQAKSMEEGIISKEEVQELSLIHI